MLRKSRIEKLKFGTKSNEKSKFGTKRKKEDLHYHSPMRIFLFIIVLGLNVLFGILLHKNATNELLHFEKDVSAQDAKDNAAYPVLQFSSKVCLDPKKLMPLCESCIPGLIWDVESQLCKVSDETLELRKTLFKIAASRGMPDTCQVYKYLSTNTLRQRQVHAGKILDRIKPERILDIGAYTNPIHSFMKFCPKSVSMLEPCGELAHDGSDPWSSKAVLVPSKSCESSSSGLRNSKQTTTMIQNVFPKSIKSFVHETKFIQHYDAVVCIGCDATYGPTWEELMTLPRPFHVIIEATAKYATDYYPNALDVDGCKLQERKDFDFSDCPDCGFDDKKQMSHFGKFRKMVVYHCGDHPQEFEKRLIESKTVLSVPCDNAKENTYRGMACTAEKISYTSIRDTAFMAVDSNAAIEKEDAKIISDSVAKLKKYNPSSGYQYSCDASFTKNWLKLSRRSWKPGENKKQLLLAKDFLKDAENAKTSSNLNDMYHALCQAGHARHVLNSATPIEEFRDLSLSSIRLYHHFLQKVLLDEPIDMVKGIGLSPGYRFPLKTCPPFLNKEYVDEVSELEPIQPDGRNIDFREYRSLISFNPYRNLMSFETVKSRSFRKKILIDVGANGFASSPKQLIDNYEANGMTFDEVIMFEPHIDGMQEGIESYRKDMNVTFHQKFVKIGARTFESDILTLIQDYVHADDFLVLKFDVDEDTKGPTMEWGFLSDLVYSEALALVDELYLELHYNYQSIKWRHTTHSARQRYDVIRQLRACGMAIHDWP